MLSRRGLIKGLAGGSLMAAFSPLAMAQPNTGVRPGNTRITGSSLLELTMTNRDVWPQNTLKLVYFGLPWNTGCSVDLLTIRTLMINLDPAGLRITPVFVYPNYSQLNFDSRSEKPPASNDTVETYIKRQPTVFTGLSGSPDKVINTALKFGINYLDSRRAPILPSRIDTVPRDHQPRLTYLMTPDCSRNLMIIESSPDLGSAEIALRLAMTKYLPENSMPAP